MPPKRARGRKTGDGDALAECVLPEDLMLCILTRLPVKSIHRFKSVCKPWLKSFSTQEFRKMHYAKFSQNPENESVVICNTRVRSEFSMSMFKIKSCEMNKPINLRLPYQIVTAHFIGCCNGLLCLVLPPSFEKVYLWNPELKMFLTIWTPDPEVGARRRPTMSLGFGYDEEADDFKFVRIVALEKEGKKSIGRVEVYSVNAKSWTTIDVGFQYSPFGVSNQTIVNGNLYWISRDYYNWVMLCFDVGKAALKIVHIMPITSCLKGEHVRVLLVDWKGDVAFLVFNKNDERVLSIDVWIFDDVRETWSNIFTFGPIELKVKRVWGFWKNQVHLEGDGGELLVFDTENGGVVKVDGARKGFFCIYGYTESLMFVEGMRKYRQ